MAEPHHLDFTDESSGDHSDDLAELREIELLVQSVPAEALLDGAPDDADLLLRRVVREVRDRRPGRTARVSRPALATIAAAALAVAIVSGIAAARTAAPDPSVTASPPVASPAPVPGTRFLDVANSADGARLTAHVVPMAGWVRVHAEVAGVPAGEKCRILVVAADGHREIAGSWQVSAKGAADGTELTGAAVVDPATVRSVVVENTAGREFVRADL